MKQSVNIDELTRKLNEFRMTHLNKTFTRTELLEALNGLGFNKVIVGYLTPQFPSEKMGTSKLYTVPKEPIHKNVVISVFNKQNKQRSDSYKRARKTSCEESNETRIAKLQEAGYIIKKCVGFDVERFAKENPVLYKKYLKYEIL